MKDFFQSQVNSGALKALPFSGNCMFCGNELTSEDTDHSVCNKCWTDTFACKTCGDETGECIHVLPPESKGTEIDIADSDITNEPEDWFDRGVAAYRYSDPNASWNLPK